MSYLLVLVGLVAGNFAWQSFGAGDWIAAIDRSYWQAVALLAAWATARLSS